jgi:hypothetical protein
MTFNTIFTPYKNNWYKHQSSYNNKMSNERAVKPNLVIVTDATSSMTRFFEGLRSALREILPLTTLVDAFDHMAMVWYRDYCDGEEVIGNSQWTRDSDALIAVAESIRVFGGGDDPEAAKTAGSKLLKLVAWAPSPAPTIVFWYADAPPHHESNRRDRSPTKDHYSKERKAIGSEHADWMKLCRCLKAQNITVYPIVSYAQTFFSAMAHITGGECLHVNVRTTAREVSFTTINSLLGIMGCPHKDVTVHEPPGKFDPKADNELHPTACLDAGNECKTVSKPLSPTAPTPLDQFLKRLPSDVEYTSKVFHVFDQLVHPDVVLSLTTNPVFGQFWRKLCSLRDDDRRDALVARLGNVKNSLPEKEQAELKVWLDLSYNRVDEIRKDVAGVDPYPALVLELAPGDKFTAQDLLEISRSTSPDILRKLTTLIINTRVMENGPLPANYLPLQLRDRRLFSYIPHLMAEGTLFDRRASMLMACVCVLSKHPQLALRAHQFLREAKGSNWQQWELPESFARGFVRLLLRVPECLTEDELQRCLDLNRIASLVGNFRTELELESPFTPEKSIRFDHKRPCVRCGQVRSLSLLTEGDLCGICVCQAEIPPETCDTNHSYMVECGTCTGQYAVVRVKDLLCKAKCHYCRVNEASPIVKCTDCTNQFVIPQSTHWSEHDKTFYKCASCDHNPHERAWEPCTITVKDLMIQDVKGVSRALGLTIPDDFHKSNVTSLLKLKDIIQVHPVADIPTSAVCGALSPVIIRKKPVRDSAGAWESLTQWCTSQSAQQGTCMLCYSDVSRHLLTRCCGRGKCKQVACVHCLKRWYSGVNRGQLVMPSHLSCPFCKCTPSFKTVRRFNAPACDLVKNKNLEFKGDWWYGWCNGCNQIKEAQAKECVAEPPALANFECEDCKVPEEKGEVRIRPCPTCGTMVEKSYGCDHITCQCGGHWCFRCGEAFESETIYRHMNEAHGGMNYYQPDDAPDDYEDPFDEDLF